MTWTVAAASLLVAACESGGDGSLAAAREAQIASAAADCQPGIIPGRHIVRMHPEAPQDGLAGNLSTLIDQTLALLGASSVTVIGQLPIINGFVMSGSSDDAARLAAQSQVLAVEPEQLFCALGTMPQSNAPAALDRIDQRDLPLDGLYNMPARGGAAVNLYILDTGLRVSHTQFQGRVLRGVHFAGPQSGLIGSLLPGDGLGALFPGLFASPSSSADPDADFSDCNGHGTHVSGTAAGAPFGVAKLVNLWGYACWDAAAAAQPRRSWRASGGCATSIASPPWPVSASASATPTP